MNVLVVARTRMTGARVCVGAINTDSGASIRLLTHDGKNLPEDHRIRPGEIWRVSCTPRERLRPPHVEDVLVSSGRRISVVADLKDSMLELVDPWECNLAEIFDGRLATTEKGTAFLRDEPPLPSGSTGFWTATAAVRVSRSEDRGDRYWSPEGNTIRSAKYVGMEEPIDVIPDKALVRFSLARWAAFPPGVDEERCYLQLSGWYL